ncbi:MAG: hypothetical protein LBH40_05670 [Alphaproteobacteria bacterium]|jgi:hypothetical protein|nr:hypothetical protein [Alphaproteobacteria bacterium]
MNIIETIFCSVAAGLIVNLVLYLIKKYSSKEKQSNTATTEKSDTKSNYSPLPKYETYMGIKTQKKEKIVNGKIVFIVAVIVFLSYVGLSKQKQSDVKVDTKPISVPKDIVDIINPVEESQESKEIEDSKNQDSSEKDTPLQGKQRESGNVEVPSDQGSMFLSPPNNPRSKISTEILDDALFFNFNDNAPFLNQESAQMATETIKNNIKKFSGYNIILETKVTDFAVSGAEAQRIAVERLLIFRSLLINAGVSPSLIRFKSIESQSDDSATDSGQKNHGWIAIKKNGLI